MEYMEYQVNKKYSTFSQFIPGQYQDRGLGLPMGRGRGMGAGRGMGMGPRDSRRLNRGRGGRRG